MNRLDSKQIPTALVEALSVLQPLHEAGYDAYIVGGAVRDTLLYKHISDIDVATSATPAEVVSIFEKTIPTGLQHGTVTVIMNGQSYEVTTFRTETTYSNHRRPEAVQFVSNLIEDLQRRDFTMNAMALNAEFYCIDPFNGVADLEAGVLRCVGNSNVRFQEDALRMLRAIRFLTTYELVPVLSLWRSLSRNKQLIRHIAMERISNEFEKIMASPFIDRGLKLLYRSEVLLAVKASLFFAQKLSFTISDRWQALGRLSDVDARWAFMLIQCELSAEQLLSDIQQLRLSKKRIDKITGLTALNRQALANSDVTLSTWLDLLEQFGLEMCELWLRELAPLTELYCRVEQLHASLHIHAVKQLNIKGSDLIKWTGKRGGPWVQNMLSQLFRLVAAGEITNQKSHLKNYILQLERGSSDEY